LAYCAKKNFAFYPLIGAAVGACVGGPIGLLVGAKVAIAAALGGGVLGKHLTSKLALCWVHTYSNLLFPNFMHPRNPKCTSY